MSSLVLYHFDSCFFCQKVRRTIDELKLQDKIELRNTMEQAEHREELIRLTGRTQVPCLVIDGKPMLESDDIVAYLRTNFG